jgi:hypothetical protein
MLYWTNEHRLQAEGARDLHELLQVALGVATAHPYEPPLVMVCGPMTTGGFGCLEKNMRAFEISVQLLREAGFNVFNIHAFQPALKSIVSHDPATGVYARDILEVFCAGIYRSGRIWTAYFLPGSENSVRARWEREFLPTCGTDVKEYPEYLWEKCLEIMRH